MSRLRIYWLLFQLQQQDTQLENKTIYERKANMRGGWWTIEPDLGAYIRSEVI